MLTKLLVGVLLIIGVYIGYNYFSQEAKPSTESSPTESRQLESSSLPQTVTLTGTYVCLPLLSGAASADCAFGIKTADGEYYAVNFGAGAGSMADFRDGETISAKGTIILAEKLNPNHWTKFESKGLFTVLEKL